MDTEQIIGVVITLVIGVWNLKVGFEAAGVRYCLASISVMGFLATIPPLIFWFIVRPKFERTFGIALMITVGIGVLASIILLLGNLYNLPGGGGGPIHYMPRP